MNSKSPIINLSKFYRIKQLIIFFIYAPLIFYFFLIKTELSYYFFRKKNIRLTYNWKKIFKKLDQKKEISILEIGSYAGLSTSIKFYCLFERSFA